MSKPNNLLQPRHDPTSQQSQIHKPAAISGHHCLEPMPTRANHSPMKHLPRAELRFPQPFSNESQLARHLEHWDAPPRHFLFPMGSPRRLWMLPSLLTTAILAADPLEAGDSSTGRHPPTLGWSYGSDTMVKFTESVPEPRGCVNRDVTQDRHDCRLDKITAPLLPRCVAGS